MKKEVAKGKEPSWFRKHWIVTSSIALFLFLFAIWVISIDNQIKIDESTKSIIETIPAVKTLLSDFPNVEIENFPLGGSTNNEKLELIREDCGQEMNEAPDHYVSIIKDDKEIRIYLNAANDQVLCWVELETEGNNTITLLKEGVYTLQQCYDECENYATSTQRDLCKHSMSTQSCDLYGKPGTALDDYIGRLKAYFASQNTPIPVTPTPVNCTPPSSGGDYGVPAGC